jgi:agmatine deiminase
MARAKRLAGTAVRQYTADLITDTKIRSSEEGNFCAMKIRLPAEWENQDGILLAWPHQETDWHNQLPEVCTVYAELIRQIVRFEKVLLVAPDPDEVRSYLSRKGIDQSNITFCAIATNDTWTRDYGPITIEVNGQPALFDFGFNGWGLKFAANLDNQVTQQLKHQGALLPRLNTIGLVLEGGSIESDGCGTIMTTSQCLLSPNRNPQLNRQDLEAAMENLFGAQKVIWLEHGHLEGDDTDAHIDTLARLCPDDTIVYVACDNPHDSHYTELQLMEQELKKLATLTGGSYRLLSLPWPEAKYDVEGQRLPASYANFLIINSAVLVPTYRDPVDNGALAMIALAFPGREIIGVDCLPLLEQHGSLHCITMQLPAGVLP